jgi:hypothetical protein
MFRQIRYQTGESKEVAAEMKSGYIPCIDVNDMEEFDTFAARLIQYGIKKNDTIPYDKNARDRVKEPEFEFRAAYYLVDEDNKPAMYLDVFFEPEVDRTYDPVGEM